MKKTLSLLVCLSLLLTVLSGCANQNKGEEKVLNIFTWEAYIDEATIIKPFTEKTGIKVNYATFSSNEEMLSKLQASSGGEYDIVLASDYVLNTARKANLLLPLDKAKVPNYKNLNPACLGSYFDPENQFTVPYVYGTPLIVYDPAKVTVDIQGYEDLWNPALKDSIVVMDDARNVIGITLKTLGQSFNTTDEAVLAQAKEKLGALRPNIRVFDYDTPQSQMLSGETTVGYMFTPFVNLVTSERPDMKVVFPKEGLGFGIDALVIPVKAPHPNNAHAFLDFLLAAENGAKIAEVQMYGNPNQAAEPLLSEAYKKNPALSIPAELQANHEFIQDLGEKEALYQDIWTAFKQQ